MTKRSPDDFTVPTRTQRPLVDPFSDSHFLRLCLFMSFFSTSFTLYLSFVRVQDQCNWHSGYFCLWERQNEGRYTGHGFVTDVFGWRTGVSFRSDFGRRGALKGQGTRLDKGEDNVGKTQHKDCGCRVSRIRTRDRWWSPSCHGPRMSSIHL